MTVCVFGQLLRLCQKAIRTALREAAARRRVRSAVREEVRALAADKHDREEMRVIREQLAELAPEPSG
jgi:predicted nucleic acid-binding protein